MKQIAASIGRLLRDSTRTCATLFKLMIPIIVVVKVVKELGWISHLAAPIEPLMSLVGLPPEMGLVWATAMANTIYAGLIVFSTVAASHPLTSAQATTLGVMILLAHNLPVEIRIAQATGSRVWLQLLLRVGGAVLLGAGIARTYRWLGVYQEPAKALWNVPTQPATGYAAWALGELGHLGMIFCIVTALLSFLRILDALHFTRLMYRLLSPVLRLIGIGPEASSLTIVGLTMGIAYGGGLIIDEARSGRLPGRDVFHSLAFLGLCHSVFEDSLLLSTIGGKFSGLLWGRLAFAIASVSLLARFTRTLSDEAVAKWLWRRPTA